MSDYYRTSSAVLMIVFNRPSQTQQILSVLGRVMPRRLYVAADAPRSGNLGDVHSCRKTLSLFDHLSWECEVFYLVNKENLGSHTTIPIAIDWFFESEESGIVLEDDCVPNETFFRFCDGMLQRYWSDESVMWINGSTLGFDQCSEQSYFFSRYALSWGWASWRRAWLLFGPDHRRSFSREHLQRILENNFPYAFLARMYWRNMISYGYTVNNWDFRWLYTMWCYGGLACSPPRNLISNIGFGIDAMHGGSEDDPRGFVPSQEITGEFLAPPEKSPDVNFEHFLNRTFYRIGVYLIFKSFLVTVFPSLRKFSRQIRGKSL